MRRRQMRIYVGPDDPPPLTLNGCIAAAHDAANARCWSAGRKEWDAVDEALAFRVLTRHMRRMGGPYQEMAANIDRDRALISAAASGQAAKPASEAAPVVPAARLGLWGRIVRCLQWHVADFGSS